MNDLIFGTTKPTSTAKSSELYVDVTNETLVSEEPIARQHLPAPHFPAKKVTIYDIFIFLAIMMVIAVGVFIISHVGWVGTFITISLMCTAIAALGDAG